MDDEIVGLCYAFVVGIIVGVIVALCVHDDAIKREQYRKYRLDNTNSVVQYEEWNKIKAK